MTRWITLFILVLSVSTPASAEWFCRSQSSQFRGDYNLLACGVATSALESEARAKALQAAYHEMMSVCNGADCGRRDYEALPMRQECVSAQGAFTCYRAIEFQFSNELKENKIINRDALEAELSRQRLELNELESKLAELRRLDRAKTEREAEVKALQDKVESTELSITEAETRLSDDGYLWKDQLKKNTIRLGVGYLDLHPKHEKFKGPFPTFYINWERKLHRYIGLDFGAQTVSSGWGFNAMARLYGWRGLSLVGGYQYLNLSTSEEVLECQHAGACVTYVTKEYSTDLSGTSVGFGWLTKRDRKGWVTEFEVLYHTPNDSNAADPGVSIRLGMGLGF